MILSKEEICRWANTSDSKRNVKEGERIINAGHIIYCGKNIDFNGSVALSAECLSISSLKREPHEIKGEECREHSLILDVTFFPILEALIQHCNSLLFSNIQKKTQVPLLLEICLVSTI